MIAQNSIRSSAPGVVASGLTMRRVLVIDSRADTARFVQLCAARGWSGIQVDSYAPQRGLPDDTFDWESFDAVLLAQSPERGAESGLDWLAQLAHRPAVPPVVMLTESPDAAISDQAASIGAAACLEFRALGPVPLVHALAECARRRKRPVGRVRELHSDERLRTEIVVPGYTLQRRLASSNLAEIYLAKGAPGELPVAVKVVHIGHQQNSVSLRRFMQECRQLARLRHPNMVRIHERGFNSNYAYIVMDYCPHGDLRTRLGMPMSVETALNHLAAIAYGLAAAHHIGIVHRGIKPTNILYRDPDTPQLTDFGGTKGLGRPAGMTGAGALAATLNYLSPEQIRHDRCSAQSDFYSLGAVLHQMLTNQPPYPSRSVAELIAAHCDAPVPRLPGAAACAQPLLDGLLAKSPTERFQSIEELLGSIRWAHHTLGSGKSEPSGGYSEQYSDTQRERRYA